MKKKGSDLTREQFKSRRKELGISVPKFAEHVGVDKTTVYKWELGMVPLPKYAERLLEALDGEVWRLKMDWIGMELREIREYLERKEDT